jgi:pyruvate/2-oxoacid:ferredoxin oxidoreductase alpha subunit
MPYSLQMAKVVKSNTAVASIAPTANWYAITPITANSSYRSDWSNKRSNKGFYTFTLDRTPGSYIG